MYKCSNSCLWCSCWWNLDFSFKSYGKESLYKYCMNVDDGRIMRSWRSCLLSLVWPDQGSNTQFTALVASTLTINLHHRGGSNILALSVPDEGYSRNGSCTLNLIFHLYVMFTGLGYEDMETLPNGLTLITSVSRFLFWPIKSVCSGKSYYFSEKVKMYQLYLWTHQKAFVGATRSY